MDEDKQKANEPTAEKRKQSPLPETKDSRQRKKKDDSDEEKSGEKLDWLLTVDGKGVNTIFNEGVCGILKVLKGAPKGTEAKKKSAPAEHNG